MGTVNTEVQDSATVPPLLERESSLAGNILLVEENHGSKAKTSAYLLQRKIKDSIHGGSVRVGFVLRDPSRSETGVWELEPGGSSDEPHQMVAVKIDDKFKLSRGQEENSPQTQDPMNELSVLQWITANDPDGKGHLLGPTILAEDSLHIYTITPYQNEGTLFDYCDTVGKLSESEVRFFFRQILEVRL
jgi:serine/threonine protein kinase